MKIKKNKSGTFMIGVLIMLLVISAISIAIVNRAIQGTTLALDSKKGYGAYQASDTATEAFLDNLKALDNELTNRIPENVVYNAAGFCVGDITCYKSGSTLTPAGAGNMLSDVYRVQSKKDDPSSGGLNRKIQADVSDRIDSGLGGGSFSVSQCGNGSVGGDGCTYNKCDIKLTINPSTTTTVTNKIQDYEVRRSIQGSLKADYLTNTDNGWWTAIYKDASGNIVPARFGSATGTQNLVIKNGDNNLTTGGIVGTGGAQANSGGQYGKDYYFTVKARNKYPLSLDSLYLDTSGTGAETTNKKVTIDSTSDCATGSLLGTATGGLKCVKLCTTPGQSGCQPVGAVVATQTNNCCNGTECFQPDTGWIPDNPHNCALQQCGSNLEGYLGLNGITYQAAITDVVTSNSAVGNGISAGIGWCGSSTNCVAGSSCTHPYRVVGYCTDCPLDTPLAGIRSITKWSKQNMIDVDMNPSGFYNGNPFPVYNQQEARCCKQDCPANPVVTDANAYCTYGANPYAWASWDAGNTTCLSANNCGPYLLTKRCNLVCSANYSPFNTAHDPEYPVGKCCSEICPSFSSGYRSHSTPSVLQGDCNYTLPDHGTSWTNSSTCNSNTKCASASTPGYTVTEQCHLNCANNWGSTNADNFTDPNKACCYHKCTDWTKPSCPSDSLADHYHYNNSYSCRENSCGEYTQSGTCTKVCDSGYHFEGGVCVYNYRSTYCGTPPTNATWVGGYCAQTWYDWYGWYPSSCPSLYYPWYYSYNCGFSCASGSYWNGSSCQTCQTDAQKCPTCGVAGGTCSTTGDNRYCITPLNCGRCSSQPGYYATWYVCSANCEDGTYLGLVRTLDPSCCSGKVVTTKCCGVHLGCGYDECGNLVGSWTDNTYC